MDTFSKKEKQELIVDLVQGFVLCKNIDDAVMFLEDLITKKELEILSKRLRIAKLLLEGYGYREIQDDVHVSHSTIAKISQWLSERGEGLRKVIKNLDSEKSGQADPLKVDFLENLKKQYPGYFLPEIILDKISKSKRAKESAKVSESLKSLDSSLLKKKNINKSINSWYRK